MGIPTRLANSSGAEPVPPSFPSTTMKSGVMPVSSIALTMHMNSRRCPMHSLKPTGLPSDRSRNCAMNCIISIGVENALCAGGEMQSTPIGTPRASAISGLILAAGNMPP